MAQLNFSENNFWLMPFGKLLDLFEAHKQYNGQAKPYREQTIDDVIPFELI